MRIHLTIDEDLAPRIAELSQHRKPQRVVNDELRRAADGDPRVSVLEAQIETLQEEIERLHATIRELRNMPAATPPAPLPRESAIAENGRRRLEF